MATCPKCGAEISLPIHRTTECPSCSVPLHACRFCSSYSPESHYECRETVDEPVRDKERANFCDHFRLTDKHVGSSAQEERSKKAKEALANLFNF
ncbi:MAG: hypothetical protein IKX15_00335 [Spirochaetales bacterium]|nr:hypothetical protein [Spirochaetales bacterium]